MAFIDKQREKEYKHEWYIQNKQRCLEQSRQYIKNNPEKYKFTQKRWKMDNPDYHKKVSRKSHLRKTYGLSLEEFDSILKEQQGQCKICHRDITKEGTAHVDHDHNTNNIRGLLCQRCNCAIGLIAEDISILSSMASYLLEIKTGIKSYDDMTESYEGQATNVR